MTTAIPATSDTPATDTSAATPNPGKIEVFNPTAALPRKPDGTVDWRATVRPENLYVKREAEDTVSKLLNVPITEVKNLTPEQITLVPDKHLVIKKAGILELLRLRGYTGYMPEVKHAERDYVVVQAYIDWAPFEGQPAMRTGAVGDARPENTSRLGAAYLGPMAANRAIALCVRNFLQIDIVSSDELGMKGVEPEQEASHTATSGTTPMAVGPVASLERAAREGGYSFEQVKAAAVARWNEAHKNGTKSQIENDPTGWAQWSDVPPRDCTTLIHLIKAAVAAKAANTAQREAAKANQVNQTNGSSPAANHQAASSTPAVNPPATEPDPTPAPTPARTSTPTPTRPRATKVAVRRTVNSTPTSAAKVAA